MPSTINGLVVLLIALIPGVPGETIFSSVTGLDWREDRLRRVIRIVLVSIAGLVLYVIADDVLNELNGFDLSDPHYIDPGLYVDGITRELLSEIMGAYVGGGLLPRSLEPSSDSAGEPRSNSQGQPFIRQPGTT